MSDIVIVGAGPAGLTAARVASGYGAQVTLIDDNPAPGGQIWRGQEVEVPASNCRVFKSTRVVSGDANKHTLLADQAGKSLSLSYSKLILATGARELFLPFPGWTLPNVFGVGGLQALAKSGFPLEGKRVVVAGSGPLLLVVAEYLRGQDAIVPVVAEQTSLARLVRFSAALAAFPGKLMQALELNPFTARQRYLTNCWVESAAGNSKVESVQLRRGTRVWTETCDYLACAYGFVANTELAELLGCAVEQGRVLVDSDQQTTIPDVYCAGEATGIGGVDLATLEGRIAALDAIGHAQRQTSIDRARAFARLLELTFMPRAELRGLAQPDTIVCRCEDVTLARLRETDSWRSAKLHERCGMGPCQGRICGPAVQFLLGWEPSSVRPPVFPTRLENLLQEHSK